MLKYYLFCWEKCYNNFILVAYLHKGHCKTKDGDNLFKRILSGLLVSAMLTGSVIYLAGCSNSNSQNGSDDNTSTKTSTEYAHADKIDNGTILQCFRGISIL